MLVLYKFLIQDILPWFSYKKPIMCAKIQFFPHLFRYRRLSTTAVFV